MKLTKEQKRNIRLSRKYHTRMHSELLDKYFSNYLTDDQVKLYCSDAETVTLKILRLEKQNEQNLAKIRYREVVENYNYFNNLLYEAKERKILLEEEIERINLLPADTEAQRKNKTNARSKKEKELELQNMFIEKLLEIKKATAPKTKRKRGRPSKQDLLESAMQDNSELEENAL